MSDTSNDLKRLPLATKAKVDALVAQGDLLLERGELEKAQKAFEEAFMLLPEPKLFYEMAAETLSANGDVLFLKKDFSGAQRVFSNIIEHANGLGNPYLHLRLGQSLFELGKLKPAAEELTRAYMGGGLEIFEGEEHKYQVFLSKFIKL